MAYEDTIPVAEPTQRGWFRRNWWWVLLLVFLGLILICAGLCAGIGGGALAVLKNSEPYQMALEQARTHPEVIERLGEPIKDGFLPTGSMDVSDGRGEALLQFKIAGPKGEAKVSSRSQLIGEQWGISQLDVTFEDGHRLVIDTVGDEDANEAPAWNPNP